MEGSFMSNRLILQRNLGTKHLIPGSHQWNILTDKRQEQCWYCGQYVLTLFIWTPRIGALSQIKDPQKLQYYKKKIEFLRDNDELLESNDSRTPYVAGSFNDFRYEKMSDAIDFCCLRDINAPDFMTQLVHEGHIRSENAQSGFLSQEEYDIVNQRKRDYYKTNWQQTIMKMCRYKKPMVANAHYMTNENLKYDPSQPVYIHVAWVRPGRHVYAISHEPSEH